MDSPERRGQAGRIALRLAAWFSVVAGAYAVIGVASLWGLAVGVFSGVLGVMVSAAVLTDRPEPQTRRIAKIGLVLSGLAFAAAALLVLVIWIEEL